MSNALPEVNEDMESLHRNTYLSLVIHTFGTKAQSEETIQTILKELDIRGFQYTRPKAHVDCI